MRSWDIAVFVIMIQMCLGFIAGLNLYDSPAISPQQGGEIYKYQHDKDLTGAGVSEDQDWGDYLSFGLTIIMASFTMIIKMIEAFVLISAVLYFDFHLAPELVLFIQGIVYLIYTWGIIQWRSGKGGKAFE